MRKALATLCSVAGQTSSKLIIIRCLAKRSSASREIISSRDELRLALAQNCGQIIKRVHLFSAPDYTLTTKYFFASAVLLVLMIFPLAWVTQSPLIKTCASREWVITS